MSAEAANRGDARERALRMGIATVTGAERLGFFSPYRHAGAVRPIGYPAIEVAFEAAAGTMRGVLEAIERHRERLRGFRGPPPGPRFDQDWFTGLDAAAAYVLARERRPSSIVEIGSGHSSRFLAAGLIDAFGPEGARRLLCIDPEPRAALDGLGASLRASLLDDEAEALAIERLDAGGWLFVDSSHLAQPGTDVDRIFTRLSPRVRAGALIHVHDVVLPDPYPDAWEWRGYNEQCVIAPLIAHRALRPAFSSWWTRTRLGARAPAPIPEGALETSLWLEPALP